MATAAIAPSAPAATSTVGIVTYSTAKATVGENGTDEVSADCPGETGTSGGGAGFTSAPEGNDAVEFAGMYPVSADLGTPDDGYAAALSVGAVGSRTVKVTTICLEPSDDPSAQTYKNTTGTIGAGSISSGTSVTCDSGELTGSGYQPYDAPDYTDVEVEELGLNFLAGDEPETDQTAISYSKQNAGFDFRSHAICSTYNVRHVYEARVAFAGLTTIKVACPTNRHVIGGGFGRYPTDLVASEPYDSKDKGKAPDDGWRYKLRTAAGIQGMYAWAACMKA